MNENLKQDALYAEARHEIDRFIFDQKVAECFDDMIRRSVPGYNAILTMIGCLAKEYVKPNTYCYDLGCSLGGATLSMRQNIDVDGCTIMAVDNAPAMTDHCREAVEKQENNIAVNIQCMDIRNIEIVNASMVVLNFTLQFIDPDNRLAMLEKIYQGLNQGGIVIISEKINFADQKENEFQSQLHHTFKKLNGYSDLEIAQKRTALDNVLVPDTLEEHHQRLNKAGFQKSYTWFQCFNFASIFACK